MLSFWSPATVTSCLDSYSSHLPLPSTHLLLHTHSTTPAIRSSRFFPWLSESMFPQLPGSRPQRPAPQKASPCPQEPAPIHGPLCTAMSLFCKDLQPAKPAPASGPPPPSQTRTPPLPGNYQLEFGLVISIYSLRLSPSVHVSLENVHSLSSTASYLKHGSTFLPDTGTRRKHGANSTG